MGILQSILNIIVQLMTDAGIMVALVALIGLLALRERPEKVFSETVKTAFGMYIILAGVNLLLGNVGSLPQILSHAFAPNVTLPQEGTSGEIIGKYGSTIGWAMLIAFVTNLILARVTRWKFVYLSGHIIWQNIIILIAIFTAVGLQIGAVTTVVIGVLLGIYDTIMPALVQPWSRKVSGSDDFGLGHSINIGMIVAGVLGGIVGKPEDSTEKLKFPDRLAFMSDPGVVAALIFFVVFALGLIFAGPAYIQENFAKAAGQHWLVWVVIQSLKGATGLLLIFYGARTLLASIVPSFRGIALRVIPNAKPALDMPVFFGYAPVALILGTVVMLITELIMMLVIGFVAPAYIVFPALIATFFEGGTAGIFGNATGGIRGAVVGAFVVGVIDMVGLATILPLTRAAADFMRILALSDYGTLYNVFAHLLKLVLG